MARAKPGDDFKHVSEIEMPLELDDKILEFLGQRMALLMLKKSALQWDIQNPHKEKLQLKAVAMIHDMLATNRELVLGDLERTKALN